MIFWRIIPFFLVLVSCSPKDQSKKVVIPESGWGDQDTFSFQFDIQDTSRLYDFYVVADFADTFAFQNLYLKSMISSSEDLSKDTIFSLELFDHMGIPLQNTKDQGLIYQGIQFRNTGKVRLDLVQYTRENNITGIQEIKIRMSPR
jgi:gliding motility-associated lipoprotein GldH